MSENESQMGEMGRDITITEWGVRSAGGRLSVYTSRQAAEEACSTSEQVVYRIVQFGRWRQHLTSPAQPAAVHPDQSSEPTTEAAAAEALPILGDPLTSTTTSNTPPEETA